MEVVINIETCEDCHHKDHSGAFTLGGSKPCCNHKDVVNENGAHRVIPYKTIYEDERHLFYKSTHNNKKVPYIVPKGIPTWCPLKNGGKY